jgi:hypothetical protein
LALHLLAAHPELNLELATSLAFEGDLDEERRALNEIAQLQASVFPLASTDAKVRFLECVDEGPGKDLDEWRKRFSAAKETDPTEDDVAEYVAWWKSRRLFPVLEHLEAERRDSYSEMAELLKEPPCWDDYQLYRVRTFSGDRPPVDESVLAGMPLEELAEYLRTWEPPGDDFRGPTIRGMAQQLESVIGKDPARFASGVVHLLDQRQEYVNAAIHGLMQAVRAGQTFDWVPVLGFLHSCTVERRYVLTGAESNEGDETLGASANLLEEGLTSQANSIPDDSLDDVWPILAPVFNDPNPSPEFELKYGGTNMDPFMLSLNTARGKATHALLTLIMQKARVAGELDLPIQDRHGVSRWTELADMLDRCLDPTRESSLAVRAAIGSQLSLLGLIDTHWLEQHLPVLFPVSDQAHREVVFDAYLLWGTIREPLIPLLRDEYRYRTSKLSEQPAVVWERREPQEALVRHVVAMYLHGDIALDDDLVCSVYSQVNQPLWSAATGRAHLGFTGRNEPPKPAEPEYLERAMNLWEWRIQLAEAAVPAGNMGDFRAELEDFGHWVVSGEVDEGWWIDQLDRATALAGRLELDGPVLDAVADVADRHAEKAARVATQLLIHDPYSFLTSAHSEAFMRIVQAAVYSGSPDANREGRDLANRLVGKGLDEFASLAIP